MSGFEIHLGKKDPGSNAFYLGIQPSLSSAQQQTLEERFRTRFGTAKKGRSDEYSECTFYASDRRIIEVANEIGEILGASEPDKKTPVIIDPATYRISNKIAVQEIEGGVLLNDGYLFPGATINIQADPEATTREPLAA